jgi:phosphocarrier protein HPr
MPERTVTVASRVGLHARPAAVFVKAASEIALPVTLAKNGGDPVNARSMLAVLGLDVRNGDEVLLSAEAADGAEEALDQLAALLETDLDG